MTKTMILSLALMTGCATLKADVKAFDNGAVTCLKEAEPDAKALGAQILMGALADALSGKSTDAVFKGAEDAAEAGAVSKGLPVAACALDGVIADLVHFLHPAPRSLMFAPLEPDPADAGQRALSDFTSKHGISGIRR
jgi:hypothetical protein